MRKKLLLLNLVLMALIGLSGSQLRKKLFETRAREREVLSQLVKPLPPPPALFVIAPVQPVSPAAYANVAQQMLFSRDRNPIEEKVVVLEPPMPALPAAYGFMTIDKPRVILAVKPGAPQKGYSAGDQIGDFTLVSVNNEEITFEWRGKQVTRPLMELVGLAGTAPPPPPDAPAVSLAPTAKPTSTIIGPQGSLGPGADMGGNLRACSEGDNTPPGTIQNGLKKMVSPSPFGNKCWWEPMK